MKFLRKLFSRRRLQAVPWRPFSEPLPRPPEEYLAGSRSMDLRAVMQMLEQHITMEMNDLPYTPDLPRHAGMVEALMNFHAAISAAAAEKNSEE